MKTNHLTIHIAWQVFLTPRYLAIAMEYVPGGDMFEHVVRKGGLKESESRSGPYPHIARNTLHRHSVCMKFNLSLSCRWFFQQLIVGVDYLHRMVPPLPHAL